MPDYYCFPLWSINITDSGNIDPSSIKISSELQQNLLKWARDFDLTLNDADPAYSGFKSDSDVKNFDAQGRALAVALQVELEGVYSIRYHFKGFVRGVRKDT